jgi:hypothetical protein
LERLARSDYAALVALAPADDGSSPSSYEHGRLELELRYAGVLEVAVELQAGDVAQAARVSTAIPELVVSKDQKSWLESDLDDLAASTEAVRAYLELWHGKPERLQRFVQSKLCEELSGCFILRGNAEGLAKAARGNAEGCQENACLVAARHPGAREALVRRVDDLAGMAAVTDNPLDRVYRLGEARRLAQAIRDPERTARLERWLAAVRPLALDPRLAIPRRTLEHVQ